MKVSKLEGAKLDYFVALALGWKHLGAIGAKERNDEGKPWCLSDRNDWWQAPGDTTATCGPCHGIPYAYSTDWSQGGPIIEREKIMLDYTSGKWWAEENGYGYLYSGDTPPEQKDRH